VSVVAQQRLTRLDALATFHNGRAFKPDEWQESGRPIIRIQNLNTPDASYNCFDGEVAPKHTVTRGDLLVSWSASLDAYLWDGPDAVLNQHIFKVEEDVSMVDRTFLYYALREKMTEIRDHVHGGTMKHITKPAFLAMRIPLPPLAEQRRIAARLNEQMAHVASARAAAEEQLRVSQSLASSYLREVFCDRTKWPLSQLGDVCEFVRGVTFKKHEAKYETAPALVPVLRAGNINGTLNLIDDLVWVPTSRVSRPQLLQVGDIAICMSSGSPAVVGKTASLHKEWTGSVGAFCGIIRPRPNVSREYVGFWFQSAAFLEWRDSQTRGANIQNLRLSQLRSLEIPMPALREQRRIAARLTRQMESIAAVRASVECELAKLGALPAALLRDVFGVANG